MKIRIAFNEDFVEATGEDEFVDYAVRSFYQLMRQVRSRALITPVIPATRTQRCEFCSKMFISKRQHQRYCPYRPSLPLILRSRKP